MDKNVQMSMMLDYYSDFLTGKQKHVLSLHYNEDMSLAEIAEQLGISRQGVHDALRRAEAVLEKAESTVQLLARIELAKEKINDLIVSVEGLRPKIDVKSYNRLKSQLDGIVSVWEE